ncbi:MAG: hypothetical protein Aureis2KO_16640 [Aureisphaera sp.]
METHFQLTDAEFEKQFEEASLDPGLFNHQAHLRLAWIHISNYGIDPAIDHISAQLKNYTTSLGAADKYHETVTVAAIRAVYHFTLKSKATTFMEFIEENPRLEHNFKDLMDAHYGFDLFSSQEARKNYLAPDLLPFD